MRYSPLHALMPFALLSASLCYGPASAEEACAVSTAGFPGDGFVADVRYDRLDEDRLRLAIEVDGVEGPHRAELLLHYGVPASFSGAEGESVDRAPSLTSSLRLEAPDDGKWVAQMALSADFPHLAFVLSLHQMTDQRIHCAERFLARVLAGSVPPSGARGQLVRFHPLHAH
ncbi:MAG: hypothetical protein AAGA68_13455 [Pseudomonadota bacterium]